MITSMRGSIYPLSPIPYLENFAVIIGKQIAVTRWHIRHLVKAGRQPNVQGLIHRGYLGILYERHFEM
jgi:hypothetical protein